MKKLGFFILLMFASISWGQQLAVTATITDSDSQTWNNGTWSVSLQCLSNQCNYNGTPVSSVPQAGSLSSGGALAVTLYNSSTITPSGATYVWTLCSNTSAPCSVFNAPVTTTNLSSLLSSLIRVPRFGAGPTAKGYLNVEVNTVPFTGATYFNVTSQTQLVWNGSAWVSASGGGAPTGPAGGVLNGTYPNPGIATNPWAINLSNQLFYFEGSSYDRAPHSGGSPVGTQLPNGGLSGNYPYLLSTSVWGTGHGTYYNDSVDATNTAQTLARYTTGNSTYGVTVPSPHAMCAAATAAGQRAFFFIGMSVVYNGVNSSESQATMISNLTTLSNDASADGCIVVLMTNPLTIPGNTAGTLTLQALMQAATDGTIPSSFVIPVADFLPNQFNAREYDTDNIHPTVTGDQLIALNTTAYMISGGQQGSFDRGYFPQQQRFAGGFNLTNTTSATARGQIGWFFNDIGSSSGDGVYTGSGFSIVHFSTSSTACHYLATQNYQLTNEVDFATFCPTLTTLPSIVTAGSISNGLMQNETSATVASALTIAPVTPFVILTGTTAIATITLPSGFTSGCFDAYNTSTNATTTAGNIAAVYTLTAATQYRICYVPSISKWTVK